LNDAARHLRGNFAAGAATRKQLRLLCRAMNLDADILLLPIRPPAILHYLDRHAGAVTQGRSHHREIARRSIDYLANRNIGYAYGSLTTPAEIIWAEACLQAAVELNVVLPFGEADLTEFLARSAGRQWVRRFCACLLHAHSVTPATTDAYQGDRSVFNYGARLSMGLAILRAQYLDATPLQAVIGGYADKHSIADAVTAQWKAIGHASDIIRLGDTGPTPRLRVARHGKAAVLPRATRAILIGDVHGYSHVPDHLIPVFQQRFMGSIAQVLQRFGNRILHRNSWGDAVYAVVDDPLNGSHCALEIQQAIGSVPLSRYGLPVDLKLRLAAHFGPVYQVFDPIRKDRNFFGAHATIAARMEPITVPGQVYVTEAMAAALALYPASGLRCEYVGYLPAAKNFGSMRMYSLRRVPS
jgi:class 3 adenylate cyclase